MVGHGGSSTGSYLTNPISPIPSHCASIVVTSTLRVNIDLDLLCSSAWEKIQIHDGIDDGAWSDGSRLMDHLLYEGINTLWLLFVV